MSFLRNLLTTKKRGEAILCVEVGAASVAGAYAYFPQGETPIMLYMRRLPVEARQNEPSEDAMMRALRILADGLIREGAPALLRATGRGASDRILVSVGAPWQKVSMRTERFERKREFVLTERMVAIAIEKTGGEIPGKGIADTSIIGTILNGYETHQPYGKKVRHASIAVLTSFIDRGIADAIGKVFRDAFHAEHVAFIAADSLRYQAMRAAFPHEQDALLLDMHGSHFSLMVIHQGIFVALVESDYTGEQARADAITSALASLAEKKYPLPHVLFVLAPDADLPSLRALLAADPVKKFWLPNNPPKIVPVLAAHIGRSVRQSIETFPDRSLLLMALFWQQRER